MITEDLEDLYKLLRGSRSATSVLDARALVQENKCVAAHVKLIDARESYMESRSRLMKQDAATQYKGNSKEDLHNRKVLLRKQEKTNEILKAFDELMPQIERLAKREETTKAADVEIIESGVAVMGDGGRTVDTVAIGQLAKPSDFSESFVSSYASSELTERLDLINAAFGFREVASDNDIFPNAIYFICSGKKCYLVRTPPSVQDGDADGGTIELTSLVDRQPFKRFTRQEFVRLGERRKMVLLTNL